MLANLTLFSLAIPSCPSPPLSARTLSFSLSSSHFSNFPRPSIFVALHRSAVFVSRAESSTLSYLTQELHDTIILPAEQSLTVKSCVFAKIHNYDGGGAVYCSTSGGVVSLTHTGFRACKSSGRGGALCIFGRSLSLARCCFEGCVAPEIGQALFSNVETLNSDDLSVRQCSMLRPCGEGHALYGVEGHQQYRTSNVSHCVVAELGACAGTRDAMFFSFHYAMVSYNVGNNLFWASGSGDARVTHCSILHNQAQGEEGLFQMKASVMRLEQCNFIGNKFTKFVVEGKLKLDGKIVIDFDMGRKLFENVQTVNLELAFKVIWVEAGMKEVDTWNCWALGRPSPSPSRSPPPLDGGEPGESGIATFLVLSFVAGIPTVLGYLWWVRAQERGRDLSVLENIQISNT